MWLLLSWWLLAAVLPSDALAILESARHVTVYSLSPGATPREKLDQKKTFHGYRILRRLDVKGETKSELLGKLYTAIAEQPDPARCFIPRHGIRATSSGETVDLVICFECKQFKSYLNGKEGGGTVGVSAEKHFNNLIRTTSPSDKTRAP